MLIGAKPKRGKFYEAGSELLGSPRTSVAFCSRAKSLIFGGLMENPLVGKKLKS